MAKKLHLEPLQFGYRYCVRCGGRLARRKDEYGETRVRCRRCGSIEYQNPKPTAGLLLVCRNELLLVKRARVPYQGWWDLPGGFVERGETLEEALEREVREELGVQLKDFAYFGSTPDLYSDNESTLASYFTKRISTKPVVYPADDVSEARWFPLRALPSRIAFAGQRKVVKDFIESI